MIIMYNTFSSMNYTFDETMLTSFIVATAPNPDGTTIIKNTSTNKLEINSLLYYQKQDIDAKISSVFKWMGSVESLSDLPSDAVTGNVYTVRTPGGMDSSAEYSWNGTSWEKLGPTLDLSGYVTFTSLTGYLSPITDRITANEAILATFNTTEKLLKFKGIDVYNSRSNIKVAGNGINASYDDEDNSVTLTVARDVQSTGAIGTNTYQTLAEYFEAIASGNFSDDSAILGSIKTNDLPAGLSNAEILIYKLKGIYDTYNAFIFSQSAPGRLWYTTYSSYHSTPEFVEIVTTDTLNNVLTSFAPLSHVGDSTHITTEERTRWNIASDADNYTWYNLEYTNSIDSAASIAIPMDQKKKYKTLITTNNSFGFNVICPNLNGSIYEVKWQLSISNDIEGDTFNINIGNLSLQIAKDTPAGWPVVLFTFYWDGEVTRIKQETLIDHLVNYTAPNV